MSRRDAAPTDCALYLLQGDSRLLQERTLRRLLEARLPGADLRLAVTRLEGAEVEPATLRAEAGSVSLLSPQRAVVLREANRLDRDSQLELARLLPTWPQQITLLLLTDPGGGRKSPLGAELTRAVRKAGQVVDCSSAGSRQMAGALRQEAEAAGKQLAEAAAQRLAELTGGDFDTALAELDKLVLYVGDKPRITVGDVEALVSSSAEVQGFKLADALGRRDAATALRLLDEILPPTASRGAAIPLVGLLARQYRLLWQAWALRQAGREGREGREQVQERFPQEHNYPQAVAGRSWLADNLSRQAARLSEPRLMAALLSLYEADRRLKGLGGGAGDDRSIMESLIAELCA